MLNSHFASLKLPSLEDACYYKLKLNILPGKYYQEGIPFSIESLDPNDICQPKYEITLYYYSLKLVLLVSE